MVITRRQILASAGAAVMLPVTGRLKVVFTSSHPGDAECGCGGSMARYAALGHDVVVLYLNRGEAYCGGSPLSQCSAIRSAEAQKACQILKARPVFARQIDGQAVVDTAHYDEIRRLLDAENPDIVFAPWPIDEHRDHRALSQLALDTWLQAGRKYAFYYYEVAEDTEMFPPTEFVDISDAGVQSLRRAACYAHASQKPDKWYPLQVELTRFRGSQSGHAQAEGFLRHWQGPAGLLP